MPELTLQSCLDYCRNYVAEKPLLTTRCTSIEIEAACQAECTPEWVDEYNRGEPQVVVNRKRLIEEPHYNAGAYTAARQAAQFLENTCGQNKPRLYLVPSPQPETAPDKGNSSDSEWSALELTGILLSTVVLLAVFTRGRGAKAAVSSLALYLSDPQAFKDAVSAERASNPCAPNVCTDRFDAYLGD